MTEKTVKVGDVVAWADVPDGALVRPNSDARVYSMRINGGGRYVCNPKGAWRGFKEFPGTPWGWDTDADPPERIPAIIIALGLTGEESAEELRRLAEVFEVRQMLRDESGTPGFTRVYFGDWATHLYDAGARRGTGVDEAWRLLNEYGD